MNQENSIDNNKIKPFLDKINLIFNSVLALPLLAFGWLYLESKVGRFESSIISSSIDLINFLVPFIILAIASITLIYFKRKVRGIDPNLTLEKKLKDYLKIAVLKYTGLGLALIISVAGFYFTISDTMVVMFVIVLVLFSINKPSALRIANNLKLKGGDRDLMMNKDNSVKKDN